MPSAGFHLDWNTVPTRIEILGRAIVNRYADELHLALSRRLIRDLRYSSPVRTGRLRRNWRIERYGRFEYRVVGEFYGRFRGVRYRGNDFRAWLTRWLQENGNSVVQEAAQRTGL